MVSQAFFIALDEEPKAKQETVARTAQDVIRDELKARREKTTRTADKGGSWARGDSSPEARRESKARSRTAEAWAQHAVRFDR